jgi:low temperature requirement protein LtrA
VFAVTQITVITAQDLVLSNVLRSVLLFWLIWWAWTQFTWTLNPADTTHRIVRGITLLATAAAFVMASSVPRAFTDDALWFAVPYLVVRLLGLGLQVRVDFEQDEESATVKRWAYASTGGLVLVLAGAFVDPPARNWLWFLAIVADLLASATAGRGKVWDLTPAHVSERHGLFVIIALGESLIVAGSAVAEEERTAELVAAGLAALAVVSALWWIYFDWFKDALEHGLAATSPTDLGRMTRDAYSLTHFPLVCGIIGVAVAVEEIMLHPSDPAPQAVLVALAAGVGLFAGSTVLAYWRAHQELLTTRLVVTAITSIVVLLFPDTSPFWPLATVAAGILLLILLEGDPSKSHRPVPTGETVA